MSKKSQRKVSGMATPAVPSTPSTPRPAGTNRQGLSVEFKPDYTEIIHDLKNTGILAGAFIAVLVILSFFLR